MIGHVVQFVNLFGHRSCRNYMLTSDVCCILFQLSDKEPDETGASIEEEVSSFIGRPVFLLPFIVL